MLKNVLSLLLSKFYSKQESEAVGHQAMPSPSNTVITPSIKTECTTWSDAHIGIAPADGYLYVTGRTTNTDGFLQISSDTTEIAATTFGNTDKDIRLLFPFAKGQAMKVTAKSLKNIFLRFSSSIGGGYQALKNALLQGGGLCLNSLSSSLRKSSLLAKKNGLDIKPCRAIAYNSTTRSLCTLHRVMDGLVFTEIQLRTWILLFCPAARLLQDLQLHKAIATTEQASLFQSQRGRNFRLFLLQVSQKFGSHQLTDPQINLAEGGASC